MLRHALEVFLINCRIPGTGSFHPYRQTHYAEVFGINKYNTIELPGSHASHLALTILPSSKVGMPRKRIITLLIGKQLAQSWGSPRYYSNNSHMLN